MKREFVVEYSQSQKAFHIQELRCAVGANARRFWNKPCEMFDWIPLFVGTRRQCELMVRQQQKRLEREEAPTQWIH